MTTRKPRTTMMAAFALLAILLGLFAFALLRANANEREDAERRFRDRAGVSAALTKSIFSSTSTTGAQQNARLFGGPVIEQKALDAEAKRSSVSYMAVLDDGGRILETTSSVDPELRTRLEGKPMVVEAVLKGQPFALSDFIDTAAPGGVMEYATRFKAADGKDRLILSGFSGQIISGFIGQYLAGIPDSSNSNAYVIDSKELVVGSPVKGQLAGKPVNEPGAATVLADPNTSGAYDSEGTERFYTVSDVGNSTWRVALTTKTADLYSGISSFVEWLILLALALAGLAAVFLLDRSVRAAAAVRQANRMLEGSNEQLARSNLELQRSNAELEQFASVASHDLQEPLRKVQTFGDQIERRFGDDIPEEAKDYLRRMRSSANRMSTLIEDLLRFSRVTTHAKPPSPVNLSEVAHEVTSDLDALLQKTQGSVDIGELPTVQADPLQMRQLMQNLIANGIKFHRPGVIPAVEVRLVTAPSGMTAFTVTDNGIGFEAQYAERIFRVFERLHPRDVFEGTGIGLALCRKIVERHGGTIVAQGRPDEGSTFTVTLPLEPASGDDPTLPAGDREPVHA